MISFEQLGPYKIGKRLGRGGMGTVYQAVNLESRHEAAIKVLNAGLSDEIGFRERFETEIETLKKLKHPRIVQLYGFGEQNGILYFAMELVPGSNLEEELQNGRRFQWREVSQVGIQLCRALKLAHDSGIIHRDIKPANILIDPHGEVKLTDFGIARLFGGMQLTGEGSLIGTAEYMAPEQAAGEPAIALSDLYSVGCVMFAMLTGRPPFRAKSLPEVLQMQRFSQPPRVTQFAPHTPQVLVEIIDRLLSKDAHARATNAGLLSKELAAMEHGLLAKTQRALHSPDEDLTKGQSFSVADDSATLKGSADRNIDSNSPTRLLVQPNHFEYGELGISEQRTLFVDDAGTASNQPEIENVSPIQTSNRFISVAEEEIRQREAQKSANRRRLFSQAALLVGILLAIGGLGWYLTRLPTADELYEHLALLQKNDPTQDLVEQKRLLNQFAERFPHDPRMPDITNWHAENELQTWDRYYLAKAMHPTQNNELSPLEQDYVLALQLVENDPTSGRAQLVALVELYEDDINSIEQNQICLQLIHRQLSRLNPDDIQISSYQKFLENRLEMAEKLLEKNTVQAQSICQNIVLLYRNRSWAADFVARAEQILKQIPRSP